MLQSFKMALKSIWGNKMRSFLTMLGIIIGVASVIILVSIVNGYMSYMVESFSSMGVNQITVQYKAVASRSIDVNEFYEFYEEHSDLYENMSPNVSVSVTVKHDSDTMDSTSVDGYSEDYLAIKDYEIEYGRNLQSSDMEARRKVAVIGAYVAEELYGGSQNAVGETVFAVDDAVFASEPPARRLPTAVLVTFSLHLGKAPAPSGVALYTRAV